VAFQAAIAASADVKAQVTAALAVRRALLEKAKADVNLKVQEINATVTLAQQRVASLKIQLKQVNTLLASATGNLALTLQTQQNALTAQLTQKAIEIVSQVAASANASANVQVALQSIANEQVQVDATVTGIASGKLNTSAGAIQVQLSDVVTLKAKLVQSLEAAVPQFINITATNVVNISAGAQVDFTIEFDNSQIPLATVKTTFLAIVGAQFNSFNVNLTISTKRAAQSTTFSAQVGSTDGSTTPSPPSPSSSGLSLPVIGGIVGGAVLLLIIIIVIIVVVRRRSSSTEGGDYNYTALRV